jgi:hypothetical protein
VSQFAVAALGACPDLIGERRKPLRIQARRSETRLVQITLDSVNDDLRLRPSVDGKGCAFPVPPLFIQPVFRRVKAQPSRGGKQ